MAVEAKRLGFGTITHGTIFGPFQTERFSSNAVARIFEEQQ